MLKKILKYFGFTLLSIIALLILLPIIFKGKIVDMVKEEANKSLNAKVDFGDFDLGLISTFPNFNFEINDVKVDGIDQFEFNLELINQFEKEIDFKFEPKALRLFIDKWCEVPV